MPLLEKHISRCEQCGAPLSSSSGLGCLNCLLLGGPKDSGTETRHFQHYEICLREDGVTLDELGRGAMGITYRALDTNLDSPAALKIINAGYSANPDTRERFRREAHNAAQLRHPNVASVFHFGETEGGQCFYAMELVEGETLEARIRRDGPLPTMVVLDVAIQIARALVAAEAHGLVHRDLKPGNLMVVANDADDAETPVVKVIDFGLAKAITATLVISDRAHPGFSGTPEFASPEQFRAGEIQLDTRSDIYSLGATLWYLLCAQTPFANRTPGDIHEQPLPLEQLAAAHVPAPVIGLLRSMLATDPAERPESARELLIALQRCRLVVETTPRRRKRRRLVALAFGLLIIGGVGLANYSYHQQRLLAAASTMAATAPLEKSIAVLPFNNLSDDKQNAYFIGGIQDEIVTALAKISGLRVISGISTANYQSTPPNLAQVAHALGVANILEGTVQKIADKVHINVQLIRADTNTALWAESYDRHTADVFGVEVEVAKRVAESLNAALSPAEKARVDAQPTTNSEAYLLYLRARDYQTRASGIMSDYANAAELYKQAIALDPNFALARARLSATLAFLYQQFQPTPENAERARSEAETALQLQPDLGEAHLARALSLYWLDKNYDAALQELTTARQILPNDSDVVSAIAYIHRRQGHWTEARAELERALSLDPGNGQIAEELAFTNYHLRDWPAAMHSGDRAVSLAPDLPEVRIFRGYVDFWSHGNLGSLRLILANIPAGQDPDGSVTLARWDVAMIARDFTTAEQVVADCPLDQVQPSFGPPLTKSYLLGSIALARGDEKAARPLFEQALTGFKTESAASPQDAPRHAYLGLLYAYLGRGEDALREGRRAVEILPESHDASDGPAMSCFLALILARTNHPNEAIPMIQRLLTTPAAVDNFEASMTLPDLQMRWQWDPLRSDPRFQQILAGPEPKTVYH